MEEVALKTLAGYGLGGIALLSLLWLVWYRETKAQPAMLDTFARQQQAEREQCQRNHEATLREMNTKHEANMKGHENTHAAIAQLTHAAKLHDAVDDAIRKRMERGDK